MAGLSATPPGGGSRKGTGSGSGPTLSAPGSGAGGSTGYKPKAGDPSWAASANPTALALGRAAVKHMGAKWSPTGESSAYVKRVSGIFNTLAGGPSGPPPKVTPPGGAAPGMPDIKVPGPTPGLNAPPPPGTPPPPPGKNPPPRDPSDSRPPGFSTASTGRMGFGTNPAGRVASFRSGTGVVRPTMNVRSF